jgi:cytochrome b
MSKALMAAAKMYDDPRFLSKSEIRIYKNKLRRQRIVRRQKMALALIAAAIVFTVSFLVSTLMLDAQDNTYTPEFKYYKEITVHAGDTMWDIANEHISYDHYKNVDAYISEVCSINNLSDGDDILAGESLIIPYYSTDYK